MTTIAIASSKGGVGKTTVALNLAYSFAKAGWPTALVDVDPQGAVGHSLPSAKSDGGLIKYLTEQTPLHDVLLRTRISELAILPMGTMAGADTQRLAAHLENGVAMRQLIAQVRDSGFHIVVVDTPCGFGGTTMGALRASDAVLAPLQAEPIALRTLPQLLEVVAGLQEEQLPAKLIGVLLTMLQARNTDSLDVAQETWSRLPAELVLETTIPRDPVFLRASSAGVPVGLLSNRRVPVVAGVFDQLASELLPRLGLDQGDDGDEPLDLFA